MSYQPIESYGIIGDLHTAALVGNNGSIDWCCLPAFDSPSIFAAILDDKKGGYFKIAATTPGVEKQLYIPESNVLITRFSNPDGVAQVLDFMPVTADREELPRHVPTIVREVKGVLGSIQMRMECFPAFNYARDTHVVNAAPGGVVFQSQQGRRIGLTLPDAEYNVIREGVVKEFTLNEGESVCFLLRELQPSEASVPVPTEHEFDDLFHHTVSYWQGWLSRSRYRGRWREIVERSLLTLKLLTYVPTGAMVAAPTCGLPETIAGVRNWDYRYTWIRDAAFTLYGLMRVGMTEEAAQFMQWLEARTREMTPEGALQVVYGLDGRHELTETELTHLEGYKESRPVRIGNGAASQLQLDIYGALMDAVYLYNKYGTPISYDFWNDLRRLLNWVCDNWQEPDEGVWEVRSQRKHFVYSKLMCWVALDRGIRLADRRSFPADRQRWTDTRDVIYMDIMTKGWNPDRQAFVQYYGSESLDASNLLMPLVFFMSPTDPRMRSTVDAITRELTKDSLVHRYNLSEDTDDGLPGVEGTFSMCTFWLVEALTRSGRLPEARFLFERMLGYANHLGLYGEEIGTTGETLGNFPQAFTHLALISTAYNLDKALDGH